MNRVTTSAVERGRGDERASSDFIYEVFLREGRVGGRRERVGLDESSHYERG